MKNNSKVLVIVLAILVLGLGGFIIYDKLLKSKDDDTKIIELGKEKYNDLVKYLQELSSTNNDYIKENDEYVKYYYKENFSTDFYKIFASNVTYKDIFLELNNGKCSSNIKDDLYECLKSYTFLLKDNKYYIDTECRATGSTVEASNFIVDSQTDNKIILNYNLVVDNSTTYNKVLELVKENSEWKINKVSVPVRCSWIIDVNY